MIEKSDADLMLVDGFTAFWRLGTSKPIFMGQLSEDRSLFLAPLDYSKFNEAAPNSLSIRYTPLRSQAELHQLEMELHHPVSVTAVNLGLATRIAMRRLLHIPVFFPKAAGARES